MRTQLTKVLSRVAGPGLAGLMLVVALAGAQPVSADSPATITLDASGAPASAWVVVQWADSAGGWHTVDGWQGNLDMDANGAYFKQWEVDPGNYGQGPFRWVIYQQPGGAVWSTSAGFYLPTGGGSDVAEAVGAAGTAAASPAAASAAALTSTSTVGVSCAGDCGYGLITLDLPASDASATAGVQWQDPAGAWHNVDSWQGALNENANGTYYAQWTVLPSNYNQGPFRWAVMGANGAVKETSANFTLPGDDGNVVEMLSQ